jgi:secernin
MGPRLTDRFHPEALWWAHEVMHRRVLAGDFASLVNRIRVERDALEADFSRRVREVANGGGVMERSHVVAQCWTEANALERRWLSELRDAGPEDESAYGAAWRRSSALAGINCSASST